MKTIFLFRGCKSHARNRLRNFEKIPKRWKQIEITVGPGNNDLTVLLLNEKFEQPIRQSMWEKHNYKIPNKSFSVRKCDFDQHWRATDTTTTTPTTSPTNAKRRRCWNAEKKIEATTNFKDPSVGQFNQYQVTSLSRIMFNQTKKCSVLDLSFSDTIKRNYKVNVNMYSK